MDIAEIVLKQKSLWEWYNAWVLMSAFFPYNFETAVPKMYILKK